MVDSFFKRLQDIAGCLQFGAVAVLFFVVSKKWRTNKTEEQLDTESKCSESLECSIDSDSRWAELPMVILEMIIKRLILPDYIRFGAVCSSWRCVQKERRYPPAPQLPWLMLSPGRRLGTQEFFSLSEGRLYTLELPQVVFGACYRAYDGWLLIHRMNFFPWISVQSVVLNPMSEVEFQLPSQRAIPFRAFNDQQFIQEIVLSSAPTPIDVAAKRCVAAGINNSGKLAFCRLGDTSWTIFEGDQEGTRYRAFAFYEGRLCGLDYSGGLWDCEVCHHRTAVRLEILPPMGREPQEFLKGVTNYLVECGGELLLVSRIWNVFLDHHNIDDWFFVPPQTEGFEVFKLDWSIYRWVEIESLGDHVLFLSLAYAVSLSVTDFPGFRGNCIYFIDENFLSLTNLFDFRYGSRKLCVFDMEDWSIEPCFSNDTFSFNTPPVWFIPNPW